MERRLNNLPIMATGFRLDFTGKDDLKQGSKNG